MSFRLTRYFTLTSLVFFAIASSGLGYIYRKSAQDNMLLMQESNNADLTRVLANQLWQEHFIPLLRESASMPSRELARHVRIQEIHRRVADQIRGSSVYKIKVYDALGRTIYSSELNQIGEDKRGNAGFMGALAGETRTELVHKDKFSAFEQVVENRDLIQSYIPQRDPGTRQIIGVFEIYSDATPLLARINKAEHLLTLALIIAFGTLYFALLLIVRRADRIIQQQARDQQRFQQQLAQSEKMSSMGQLVAGVAHQLNTPIAFSRNNIILALDVLHNDSPSDAEVDAVAIPSVPVVPMLEDVLEGLDQMRDMVTQLRNFTRIDRATIIAADLNTTLHTVVYIARSTLPTRIRITEDFSPLPEVECNPSQLNQMFINLINNAADAITAAGEIRVRSYVQDGRVHVEVIDDGTGIPADVLPHIFESYYTTKPGDQGTGLGLPIVADIVKSHCGEIHVETKEGSGTRFTVTLPVLNPDLTSSRPRP